MKKLNKKPSFNLEQKLFQQYDLIFGIDEVGRGSFAGPIVAAAVCFKKEYLWFDEIYDSKLLTKAKREKLSKLILKNGLCFIELIDIDIINEFGIGEANRLIFQNLLNKIQNEFKNKKLYYLIDGNKKQVGSKNVLFIIKGDSKNVSIAAASIIAKVFRDALMDKLEKKYVGYDFSKNKGYGTKYHQQAIKKLGLSKLHRTSFNLLRYLD